MRVGTDCSGIEAPLYALKALKVKYDHVFSCENDKFARQTLQANHNPRHMYGDITKRKHKDVPRVDLYVAGFPCQPFSNFGKALGLNDRRANVFFHCFKYIKLKTPKVFVLENVKGIKGNDEGRTYIRILKMLNSLKKYEVDIFLLNTQDYGVPQNRERIFFIGRRKNIIKTPLKKPKSVKLRYGVIEYLKRLNLKITKKTHPRLFTFMPCETDPAKLKYVKKKYNIKNLKKYPIVVDLASSPGYIGTGYNVTPTLRAQRSTFYIPKMGRKTSVKEALALQGFPKSFKIVVSDNQILKQVGNSMSVNVLKHLFREIFKSIKK